MCNVCSTVLRSTPFPFVLIQSLTKSGALVHEDAHQSTGSPQQRKNNALLTGATQCCCLCAYLCTVRAYKPHGAALHSAWKKPSLSRPLVSPSTVDWRTAMPSTWLQLRCNNYTASSTFGACSLRTESLEASGNLCHASSVLAFRGCDVDDVGSGQLVVLISSCSWTSICVRGVRL